MTDRFSNHIENRRFISGCHIKKAADSIYDASRVLELAEESLKIQVDGVNHPDHAGFADRIKDVRWKLDMLIDRLAKINSEMGNEP